MSDVFICKDKDGEARTAELKTKTGVLSTPCLFTYTRRGYPLSLCLEIFDSLKPMLQGVEIDAMQFLENPDPATLHAYGKGAHKFFDLEGLSILASNRDPSMYEYGVRNASNAHVHVSIHSGGHLVTPQSYMDVISALKPDIFVALADEIKAVEAGEKRVRASLKRNADWLQACLDALKSGGGGAGAAAVSGSASVSWASKRRRADLRSADEVEVERPRKLTKREKRHVRAEAAKIILEQKEAQKEEAGQVDDEDGKGLPAEGNEVNGALGVDGGAATATDGFARSQAPVEAEVEEVTDSAVVKEEMEVEKEEEEVLGATDKSPSQPGQGKTRQPLVLVPVGGGMFPRLRLEAARTAATLLSQSGVPGGFVVSGLGTGEGHQVRRELIKAAMDGLREAGSTDPAQPSSDSCRSVPGPVFAPGLLTPLEQLEAISLGVDLFDGGYVGQMTTAGFALVFPLRPAAGGGDEQAGPLLHGSGSESGGSGKGFGEGSAGDNGYRLSLMSTENRSDPRPFLEGCGCFACRKHTRAYVHHLLQAHEMLADILLEAHNTHHMLGFFAAVREAIAAGRLEQYTTWFREMVERAATSSG